MRYALTFALSFRQEIPDDENMNNDCMSCGLSKSKKKSVKQYLTITAEKSTEIRKNTTKIFFP